MTARLWLLVPATAGSGRRPTNMARASETYRPSPYRARARPYSVCGSFCRAAGVSGRSSVVLERGWFGRSAAALTASWRPPLTFSTFVHRARCYLGKPHLAVCSRGGTPLAGGATAFRQRHAAIARGVVSSVLCLVSIASSSAPPARIVRRLVEKRTARRCAKPAGRVC